MELDSRSLDTSNFVRLYFAGETYGKYRGDKDVFSGYQKSLSGQLFSPLYYFFSVFPEFFFVYMWMGIDKHRIKS